jgi:hypothetical protein
MEQTLTIQNNSTNARVVTITQLRSGLPTTTNYPAWAGDVPLSYWKSVYPTNVGFFPLTAALSQTVGAGGKWSLRLAVRRSAMAAPASAASGALYQSLLNVSDGAGSRWLVPVTAQGIQSAAAAALVNGKEIGPRDAAPPCLRSGLWIGSADIKKVSYPASITDAVTPISTFSDFQFRLILHVDTNCQARLLQKVLLMWQNGTYVTNSTGYQVVSQSGNYVLLTKDSLIPNYRGAAMRDGQLMARRISSAGFGFRDPVNMAGSGAFGDDGSIFSCTNILDYRDILNPFVHRYHPDHDNLDDSYHALPTNAVPASWPADTTVAGPATAESFTVTRYISLQFSANDPDNLKMAGWGDNQIGGTYKETITGLHKNPLYIQGTFRLHQASSVGVLNDGLGL